MGHHALRTNQTLGRSPEQMLGLELTRPCARREVDAMSDAHQAAVAHGALESVGAGAQGNQVLARGGRRWKAEQRG